MIKKQPVLAMLLTEDWFFASHFWARALAAQKAGWRVVLITRENSSVEAIRASGIECISVDIGRKSLNPFRALLFVLGLASIYRRIRPDIAHHVALKPIILGGIAAWLARVPAVVSAPVGLGFIFSSDSKRAAILRPIVKGGLRLAMNSGHGLSIFENPDDLEFMVKNRLVKREQTRLIRGAGVDTDQFSPVPEAAGKIRVLLAARLILEKGVLDFVKAAQILQGQAEFCLAGAPDHDNPHPIHESALKDWAAGGTISWLGPVTDMASLIKMVHILVLPSLTREGLPKVILEAMACGRPVVATNIPGCREAVEDEETGILVPPHNPETLARALHRLIIDPALRARMGAAGRERVMKNFSDDVVCEQTFKVYNSLRKS